jgi:hypothetical protein
MGTWSELGRQGRVDIGRQVHLYEQETPGWIQPSCPCSNFFRGSGRRCTLVLMSMAGWCHACLGRSGIRRSAGALDIRTFLDTAAISSTGGHRSRVSLGNHYEANSLWHWRRRKTACFFSGRRGNDSRGVIIPSTTEHRSVCLTARYLGEKRLVLCAAKDETSVDIMCRKLFCDFLRKSRLRQIWLARRLTPDVATVNE